MPFYVTDASKSLTKRLDRTNYALGWLGWLVLNVLGCIFCTFLSDNSVEVKAGDLFILLVIILMIASMVLRSLILDVPRLRSMGWPVPLAIMLVFPVLGLAWLPTFGFRWPILFLVLIGPLMQILLFIVPPSSKPMNWPSSST